MEVDLLDDEGFLINPDFWNEEISRSMAKNQFNIHLTDLQVKIIIYVREYYKKWGTLPIIKTIRSEFNLETQEIDNIFKKANSTSRGVICKLAGLPKLLCIASGC